MKNKNIYKKLIGMFKTKKRINNDEDCIIDEKDCIVITTAFKIISNITNKRSQFIEQHKSQPEKTFDDYSKIPDFAKNSIAQNKGFLYIIEDFDNKEIIIDNIKQRANQVDRINDVFVLNIYELESISELFPNTFSFNLLKHSPIEELKFNILNLTSPIDDYIEKDTLDYMFLALDMLVVLRDLNLIIDIKEVNNAAPKLSLETIKGLKKEELTIDYLNNFKNMQNMIDLAYYYNSIIKQDEVIENLKNNPIYKDSINIVENYANNVVKDIENRFVKIFKIDLDGEKFNTNDINKKYTKNFFYIENIWNNKISTYQSNKILFGNDSKDTKYIDAINNGKIIILTQF